MLFVNADQGSHFAEQVGWGRILNKLAAQYPNVVTVNIDDFVDSLVHVFNQTYVSKIYAALHGPDGPGVSLIPTYYYGSKANFVMTENPWLTFERGPGPSPRSPGKCAPVAKGEVPKGKGCIVADLFAKFGGEEPTLGLA